MTNDVLSLIDSLYLFIYGGEAERKSFTVLRAKGGHSRLMPSELCVPT